MPNYKPMPPRDVMDSYLRYDHRTGIFHWKVNRLNGATTGDVAGSIQSEKKPYIAIKMENVTYLAHRLAWFWVTREDPGHMQIDHINGNKSDNRIENLRKATQPQNSQNQKKAQRSQTGGDRTLPLGVYTTKRGRPFNAQITHLGKRYSLGNWDTPELAHNAYLQAKTVLHPFQTIVEAEAAFEAAKDGFMPKQEWRKKSNLPKGVYELKGRYQAFFRTSGTPKKYLGYYDTSEQAEQAIADYVKSH